MKILLKLIDKKRNLFKQRPSLSENRKTYDYSNVSEIIRIWKWCPFDAIIIYKKKKKERKQPVVKYYWKSDEKYSIASVTVPVIIWSTDQANLTPCYVCAYPETERSYNHRWLLVCEKGFCIYIDEGRKEIWNLCFGLFLWAVLFLFHLD